MMIQLNKRIAQLALCASISALLTACGGGGEGDSVTPPSTPNTPTSPSTPSTPNNNDGGGSDSPSDPTPTPSASITSSATTAVVNDQVTVSWSSVGATTCTATGNWSGQLAASGTQSIKLTATGTVNYGVSCGTQTASVNVKVLGQYVAIPDAVFADALTRVGYPVTNGQMLTTDALSIKRLCITSMKDSYGAADSNGVAVFTNTSIPDNGVKCAYTSAGKYITDLTGLESMVNLQSFRIEHQQFHTVDLSTLKDVILVSLWGNPLTSIDFTGNSALLFLGLSETSLTAVDLTGLTSLVELGVQQDSAKTLPYTLPNGTVVKGFASLDLSKTPVLQRLYVANNGLTSLDLSKNPVFRELHARNNALQTLDLSGLTALDYVIVANNNLTSLNLKGIAYGGIPSRFYAENNPGLTTIFVTNPAAWTSAGVATQAAWSAGQASSTVVSVDSQAQFVAAP
jgi:hypothetical protein